MIRSLLNDETLFKLQSLMAQVHGLRLWEDRYGGYVSLL